VPVEPPKSIFRDAIVVVRSGEQLEFVPSYPAGKRQTDKRRLRTERFDAVAVCSWKAVSFSNAGLMAYVGRELRAVRRVAKISPTVRNVRVLHWLVEKPCETCSAMKCPNTENLLLKLCQCGRSLPSS